MAYTFNLHKESLKRKFAVYVVIAKSQTDTKLYVGKTGDNNDGCNPLISRCGNHFSYNKMHSQVRNKLDDHEERDYTYVFDHFDDYPDDPTLRRACVEKINEIERWLNEEIQRFVRGKENISLLNPFSGIGYLSKVEQSKRREFRTAENEQKISHIVAAMASQVR